MKSKFKNGKKVLCMYNSVSLKWNLLTYNKYFFLIKDHLLSAKKVGCFDILDFGQKEGIVIGMERYRYWVETSL